MGCLVRMNDGTLLNIINLPADAVVEDSYPKEFYKNKKKYGRKRALEMLKESKEQTNE